MENASKALIIAGAILLSILIIGIAMFIFNSASETIDQTASRMSQQEKQTHNQRFQKFEGARRSGTDVKALVNELLQNYSTQTNNGELGRIPQVQYLSADMNKEIPYKASTLKNEFHEILGNIKATRAYEVEVRIHLGTGIVDAIGITEEGQTKVTLKDN